MQFITHLAQCQLCYIALPGVKMCDNLFTPHVSDVMGVIVLTGERTNIQS